jgi:hypothetical protein
MVIEEVIPCEDAHAQERSLLAEVVPIIRPGYLIIDDRDFCTLAFLFAVMARGAYFVTRQHGRMPWTPRGKVRYVGRTETGRVYERDIELHDPETGEPKRVRRVTVMLPKRWARSADLAN